MTSLLDRAYAYATRSKVMGTPAYAVRMDRERRSLYWGFLVDQLAEQVAEAMARGSSELTLQPKHEAIRHDLEMAMYVHHALAVRMRALGWPTLEWHESGRGFVTLHWRWP
jgi:hypothetical protein